MFSRINPLSAFWCKMTEFSLFGFLYAEQTD